MRCLHIFSSGEQCPAIAVSGEEFCEAHLPLPVTEEPAELPFAYRLLRRAGAVLFLLIFLTQLYVSLRLLYGW